MPGTIVITGASAGFGEATARLFASKGWNLVLAARRRDRLSTVFGWVKQVLGFRSFSLRGLPKVSAEWKLVCLAVNLKRMSQSVAWK